ncbi:TorF family putative porin [Colwellia psychrerythraea]|uniref:TIGR02001 family outer membrane protein n=1 Tax=Colwellia psychrerythraea TaxID=28229 RepID=A0A099KW58_COLPS|nr:TorF family putative porin [Colwellia psychrerythraea]KGJ94430.1 Conserved hypothetical protein CHP02001 [Colwellia psychrerythraea]
MNKIKLLAATLALTAIAPLVSAEVSVTGTLTSDYVFRGVSQTDSSPAIQASLDYEHESGFFAGVWASNVDFEDDANAEIDFYAGYFGEVNDTFSYDVMYNYYTYQGYSSADDSDYGELLFNAYINAFTLGLGYASDYVNTGDSAQYISAAYDIELPQEYALTLQAGYTMGDAFDDAEYIDYSATVAKTFFDFDFTAAVINTDIDDADNADFRFVLGVSRTF